MSKPGANRQRKDEELVRLVESQYEVLSCLFRAYYGDGKTACGLPRYLSELLPQMDGWFCSPNWVGPRRIAAYEGSELHERRMFSLQQTGSGAGQILADVERSIFHRAQLHQAIPASQQIISHGLKSVTGRVLTFSLGLPLDTDEIISWISLLRKCSICCKPHSTPSKLEEHLLMTLRINWLRRWLRTEEVSIARLRRRNRGRCTRLNISSLIKPAEVEQVYVLYLAEMGDGKDPVERLGAWYARTLYLCGGGWRSLLDVRRRSANYLTRRHGLKRTIRGSKAWGLIAERRITSHFAYLERRKKLRGA